MQLLFSFPFLLLTLVLSNQYGREGLFENVNATDNIYPLPSLSLQVVDLVDTLPDHMNLTVIDVALVTAYSVLHFRHPFELLRHTVKTINSVNCSLV